VPRGTMDFDFEFDFAETFANRPPQRRVGKKFLLYDFLGELHLAQIRGCKIYYDLHDMQHSAKSN
jgi:hypothetical protein